MMDIEDLQRVYREVFSSDEGKRVLDDLKARFGFQQTTHVPGYPYESAYFEGQRNAVLLILRMMEEKRKDLTSE